MGHFIFGYFSTKLANIVKNLYYSKCTGKCDFTLQELFISGKHDQHVVKL
jgi:hypothetical protein